MKPDTDSCKGIKMTIDNALFELANLMAQGCSFAESNFRFGLEEGKTVLASLKNDFDTSFECLLEKLNALTGEILLKCFGDSPNSVEKKKSRSSSSSSLMNT